MIRDVGLMIPVRAGEENTEARRSRAGSMADASRATIVGMKRKNAARREDPLGRESRYHRLFALKAAREAGRVLPLFERERPGDDRPREAIRAITAWARGRRKLGMAEVRALALAAHAAARASKTEAACYAARAAGHAVATWHAPTHSLAAFAYGSKASCAAAGAASRRRKRRPTPS